MPPKPKPAAKRNPKPNAAKYAINGNISDSAIVQGENNNILIGSIKAATQEEKISAMFNELLDNEISDFVNNYNTKRG